MRFTRFTQQGHIRLMSSLSEKAPELFPISREEIGYKRYLTVWQREVVFPEGQTVAWEVVGHATPNPAFATVFPFNTETVRLSFPAEPVMTSDFML